MANTTYKIGVVLDGKGITSTAADLGKADAQLNKFGATAKAAFASFAGNLASDAFQKITSLAVDGGKAIFNYNEKLAATKIGLDSLVGSQAKANALFKEIDQFSNNTPFDSLELTKLAQRLVSTNVELKKVVPLMRDIGNVVAATGEASQERLEGVTVAISQMIAKGKVSAEEMEQLAERGVPAWQLLSQATGKTVGELRKLSEQGGITSDVMIRSLQKISKERFGDAMAKQSELASVSLAKIQSDVIKAAANASQPILKEIASMSARLRSEIQKQKGDMQKIGELITKYIAEGLGKGIGSVLSWLGSYVGRRLKEIFTEGKVIDPITKGIATGLSRGLTDGLGLTTPEVSVEVQTPKVFNYDRGPVTPAQDGLVTIDPTKELLEKQRKEREEAFKKEIGDLQNLNKAKIEAQRLLFENANRDNESLFKAGQISFEAYKENALQSVKNFSAEINDLMRQGLNLELKGKTGTARSAILQNFDNEMAKIVVELNRIIDDTNQIGLDKQKEASEESIKITQTSLDRRNELAKASEQTRLAQLELDLERGLVTEYRYAEAVALIQLQTLEDEKARHQELLKTLDAKSDKYAEVTQKIKLLDEQLAQQQIANARAIEKAWADAATARDKLARPPRSEGEDGATPAPGPGKSGNWLEDWLGLGTIQQQTDIYQNVLVNLQDMTKEAFSSMGSAVGDAVGAWVLYGDAVGGSLKKATAATLANLAQQATVKAIFELAEGFAALAVHDYPGAAKHFTASAIYGTVAGVAAIAGRAIAGDSFSQSGQASNRNQPDYYTSAPQNRIQTSSSAGSENTAVFQGLREEIAALHNKIGSARPGDILTAGAKEKPGFIGQQTTNDLKRNGSLATDMGKQLRLG